MLIMVIIFIFVGIQSPTLRNPPWENYDSWRQGDTYSIAVNFYQREYNIMKPQFNYDGPKDNYVQLELQIMPFLAASVFKLINKTTPVILRGINLLFFLGSALYVYLIMRRFTKILPSAIGLAVYLFMPITFLYSRAVMPESPALFFYCGGVYYLLRWYFDNNNVYVWISAVFVAIAITQKAPIVFVGILILYTFIRKLKTNCIRSGYFYGYGLIALGIPAIYYFCASVTATFKFVDGIAAKHIFTNEILSIFTKKGFSFFLTNMPMYFGWVLVTFGCVGLLLSFSPKRRFILVWAFTFLLEWALIAAVIRLGYYLIFMAPVLAILCAIAIGELWKWKKQIAVFATVLLVCSTAYLGVVRSRSQIKIDEKIETAVAFIEKYTEKDDIIAVASINPIYLSGVNRRGYRANIKYHNHIPQNPEDEIKYFIDHGVDYFFVVEGGISNDNNGYFEYLKANYPIVDSNDHCALYRLRAQVIQRPCLNTCGFAVRGKPLCSY